MIRRIRLAAGLVMLAYVTMHLINHALGLVSIPAMGWALTGIVFPVWSFPPMQLALYGAFVVHYALALWALWERRTLRLRGNEYLQLVLGFLLPLLLAHHVVGTRVSDSFFGTYDLFYRYVLWVYFVGSPWNGYLQLVALVVAWTHAMLGLHFWLRIRPWYARWREAALTVAVLMPVLSLLGTVEAGRQIVALDADPAWRKAAFAAMRLPTPADAATLSRIADTLMWFFAAAVAAVLLGRCARRLWRRRHGVVRITYPNGRFVDVVRGTSVLEASRLARIPHASICGGRGRCSTCRVRVRAAYPGLPPPGEDERRVLARIGATANVRLACMLRPAVEVQVTPLLPPVAQAQDALTRVDVAQGSEREIVIMFADIRGFTALAEGRLPYDVVFILNRYFATMGRAVESAGGRVDKFVGDGIMALFGVEDGVVPGCRAALAAARLMSERLVELNEALAGELAEPLRIGIGIHAGPAIVGEMGYGEASAITAIGDPVNTASRLEGLAKEYAAELVVSAEVIGRTGIDVFGGRRGEIEIRGRQQRLQVAVFASARDLPEIVDPAMSIEATA
ncbi:MAG TPA: adenylate/guanylate cyclase domain-containing protein [Stellaceae bacterium]|jgi:adenylate cyclase|nr:adenylate/guanylate cyclase domain-containing protein [Stellaceae bacterium]